MVVINQGWLDRIGDLADKMMQGLKGEATPDSAADDLAIPSEDGETNLTAVEPYRRKLVQISLKLYALARFIHGQSEEPLFYALVLAVLDPATTPDLGSLARQNGVLKVKVLKSQKFSQFIGQTGYAVSGADKSGEVTVLFEDGSYGTFGIGQKDKANSELELEVAPEDKRRVVVTFDGRLVELKYPEGLELKPGDAVQLSEKTSQIVGKAPVEQLGYGEIVTIQRLIGDKAAEVRFRDTTRIVSVGAFGNQLEPGNQAVVNASGTVIVQNLGDPEITFRFDEKPVVTWDDIGGQQGAKDVLQQAIVLPFMRPDLFRRFSKRRIKGILLFGPPGNGKGMLAEAAASEILKLHGQVGLSSGFFHVKGPEIYRSLVGDAEALLRLLFQLADKHEKKYGFPAVIFIDEAEAVGKKRGTGISSDATDSLVQTLLAAMNSTTAVVIMATNRQDILDPALIRHKRIDRKVYVGRPENPQIAADIFYLYLKNHPLAKGLTARELADFAAAELFSDHFGMYQLELQGASGTSNMIFGLQHMCSGAMIDGIVEQATSLAMDREVKTDQESYLTKDDLVAALNSVFQQELLIDHGDDTKEFSENLTDRLVGVKRLYQGRK